MATKKKSDVKVAADNRKARHNFFIDQVLEAGIVLVGTEVKGLREGHATIGESYATAKDGDIMLINANIPEYSRGNRENHEAKRPRKLLLHKRELAKLTQAVTREGMTLIPLKIYFNEQGRAKVELGLAKGKKLHDKRETDKERSWKRDKARLMRQKG
ncbi:MAG TPA: SsrA-binding protein [Alphaproteobacteria bacterium]|nr:SsrA-binding protein [Alphaproteobacteria bacterium]HAJ47447.1 SsrA-binding protein [Alphaproteobacteria bacterium]